MYEVFDTNKVAKHGWSDNMKIEKVILTTFPTPRKRGQKGGILQRWGFSLKRLEIPSLSTTNCRIGSANKQTQQQFPTRSLLRSRLFWENTFVQVHLFFSSKWWMMDNHTYVVRTATYCPYPILLRRKKRKKCCELKLPNTVFAESLSQIVEYTNLQSSEEESSNQDSAIIIRS